MPASPRRRDACATKAAISSQTLTSLQKPDHCLGVGFPGEVKGGMPVRIANLTRSPVLQEQLHHGCIASAGGRVQCGGARRRWMAALEDILAPPALHVGAVIQ